MKSSLIQHHDFKERKTKYGREPSPYLWYYAHKLVSTYTDTDPPSVEEVIRQFESAGCNDEIAASKWIVVNDELVP
jgi:hypothetical protein